MNKICSKCKTQKDSGEFNKNSAKKDGLQSECRSCSSLYSSTKEAKDSKVLSKKNNKRNLNVLFTGLKARAKRRHIEFLLTIEDFTTLATEHDKCYYCGRTESKCIGLISLIKNFKGNDPRMAKLLRITERSHHSRGRLTIDRLNSFGPYSKDNCVLACSLCNDIKGWAIGSDEWKLIANTVIGSIEEITHG